MLRSVLVATDFSPASERAAARATPYQGRAVIEQARAASPKIDIVARTHSEVERTYLERQGVALALIGERELALGLARHALIRMGCAEEKAAATVQSLRQH